MFPITNCRRLQKKISYPHKILRVTQGSRKSVSSHSLILRTLLILHSLTTTDIQTVFIWIPANIKVQLISASKGMSWSPKREKASPNSPEWHIHRTLPPPASYLAQYHGVHISKERLSLWKSQTDNEHCEIKKEPIPRFSFPRQSRREKIVITYLGIGHTFITNTHLFNKLFPLDWSKCHADDYSVDHIFTMSSS